MSIEWVVPIVCIVLAVLVPDTTLKWIFGLLGVFILGFFIAHSTREK